MRTDLHTFVISAWKESPYIEETLRSLVNQKYPSKVIVATSSPNDFLKNLCAKYKVEYIINPDVSMADSAVNWSFALSCARTKYVTLAHQDDVYLPDYSRKMVEAAEKHHDVVISFSRCCNWQDGKRSNFAFFLLIKDILLLPYFLKRAIYSPFLRRIFFAFGNPICCPSVMYNKSLLNNFQFSQEVKVDFDWEAMLRLSQEKGCFLFVPHSLLLRRIHNESGTTITYQNGSRFKDDLAFFKKFWPAPIARILSKLYSLARFLN